MWRPHDTRERWQASHPVTSKRAQKKQLRRAATVILRDHNLVDAAAIAQAQTDAAEHHTCSRKVLVMKHHLLAVPSLTVVPVALLIMISEYAISRTLLAVSRHQHQRSPFAARSTSPPPSLQPQLLMMTLRMSTPPTPAPKVKLTGGKYKMITPRANGNGSSNTNGSNNKSSNESKPLAPSLVYSLSPFHAWSYLPPSSGMSPNQSIKMAITPVNYDAYIIPSLDSPPPIPTPAPAASRVPSTTARAAQVPVAAPVPVRGSVYRTSLQSSMKQLMAEQLQRTGGYDSDDSDIDDADDSDDDVHRPIQSYSTRSSSGGGNTSRKNQPKGAVTAPSSTSSSSAPTPLTPTRVEWKVSDHIKNGSAAHSLLVHGRYWLLWYTLLCCVPVSPRAMPPHTILMY